MMMNFIQILQEDVTIDQAGRQSLLSTYVQYQCKIPHPSTTNKSGLIASRSGDELERSNSSDMNYLPESSGGSLDRLRTSDYYHDSSTFTPQIRLLHEEIALHWVVSSGNASEMSMTNSWFLFELIIKSMIEHLDVTKLLLNAPRKNRFNIQYTDDLLTLVHLVATKVIGFHETDPKMAQSLNASLAFFIFDLLSIADRGFCFGLIKVYYKVIIARSVTIPDLIHYKLDFLRIVCSHEHFIALNLPFATPYTLISAPCSPTPSTASNNSNVSNVASIDKALYSDLSVQFRQHHFLIGLVLQELATVLEIP